MKNDEVADKNIDITQKEQDCEKIVTDLKEQIGKLTMEKDVLAQQYQQYILRLNVQLRSMSSQVSDTINFICQSMKWFIHKNSKNVEYLFNIFLFSLDFWNTFFWDVCWYLLNVKKLLDIPVTSVGSFFSTHISCLVIQNLNFSVKVELLAAEKRNIETTSQMNLDRITELEAIIANMQKTTQVNQTSTASESEVKSHKEEIAAQLHSNTELDNLQKQISDMVKLIRILIALYWLSYLYFFFL